MKIIELLKQAWVWVFGKHTPNTPTRSTGRHSGRSVETRLKDNMTGRKQIALGVRQWFDENYELRYNILKQTEEFRPRPENSRSIGKKSRSISQNSRSNFPKVPLFSRNSRRFCPETGECQAENGSWQQLTDRELRRMAVEQMADVGVAWAIDVELYVRSAMLPRYNPLTDYLDHCPQWDGQTDHIRAMARRVPTDYAAWPDVFHRWMLAMVAQWLQLSPSHGNALVPMLIGGQGIRKSTFCRLLLPPELREYYADDIKLDSAEQVERMLGRMALVNIDEYNAKTTREQAKIKRVLTEHYVQTRKMRSDQYLLVPRMASFIATTNDSQPLTDPTGSRRYLCCEVTGPIDTDTPVDHRQLYAQAVSELRAGEPYYFTKAEEDAIEQHNMAFRLEPAAESLVKSFYEPASRERANFVRAADLLAELAQKVSHKDLPTLSVLTMALKNLRFPHGAIKGQRGWYVRRLGDAAGTADNAGEMADIAEHLREEAEGTEHLREESEAPARTD